MSSLASETEPEKHQLWFLITCIMSSEAGKIEKIDWDVVTEKLNLPSKNAARMRYMRLLASYGLTTSFTTKDGKAMGSSPAGDSTAPDSTPPAPKKRKKSAKRARPDPEQADEAHDTEEI